MTDIAIFTRHYLRINLPFLRNAILLLLVAILVNVEGPTFESAVMPVLTDQAVTNVAPDNAGRLCFDWSFHKTRWAIAEGAFARVFIGDEEYPLLVGIEHDDGTPFGQQNSRAIVNGLTQIRACVKIPPLEWAAYRIGVQVEVDYKTEFFPWTSHLESPWIDYYSPSVVVRSK